MPSLTAIYVYIFDLGYGYNDYNKFRGVEAEFE